MRKKFIRLHEMFFSDDSTKQYFAKLKQKHFSALKRLLRWMQSKSPRQHLSSLGNPLPCFTEMIFIAFSGITNI